jgi:putative transposase
LGGEANVAGETTHHGKLHHRTPGWVATGTRFHIRLRSEYGQRPLTNPELAAIFLRSAQYYHQEMRWYVWLFLLMPDHLHAILSFPQEAAMGRVVGDWKRYLANETGVRWQDNYFDHRLRSEDEFIAKCHYIRMNPVRKGLCSQPEQWAWMLDLRSIVAATSEKKQDGDPRPPGAG